MDEQRYVIYRIDQDPTTGQMVRVYQTEMNGMTIGPQEAADALAVANILPTGDFVLVAADGTEVSFSAVYDPGGGGEG